MKKLFLTLTFALPFVIGCQNASDSEKTEATTSDTTVATEPATATAPPMDSAAMMKAWQDYMTPGDMHKMLEAWSGKWTGDITMWMAPDAPPTQSTGTAESKMILGGRYQESVHKGMMGGMPFEGRGIVAYDNAKKVFVSSWIDNMGTGVMQLEGPWDAASKSMTLKGDCVDPASGKKMAIREVVTVVDDKHQTMEMYMTQDGKEYKSMEIKSTKQ